MSTHSVEALCASAQEDLEYAAAGLPPRRTGHGRQPAGAVDAPAPCAAPDQGTIAPWAQRPGPGSTISHKS